MVFFCERKKIES